MQSMFITTNIAHCEVYLIQHYVIKFVSVLQLVQWFSPGTAVSSTNKTDHHDITEILLKVALHHVVNVISYEEWCQHLGHCMISVY